MLATLEAKIIAGALGLMLLAGIFAWHKHEVSAAYKQGKKDEAAHIEAKALEIKNNVDALTSNISSFIRSSNDAENNRIHGVASVMLVRGPGRAACADRASVPAAAGGSQPASGPSGAPLARVPYPEWQQLIGMPFAPTVGLAEQHDLNRAEVLSWRDWYKRESDAWPKPPAPKKRSLIQRIFN